MQNEFDKLRWRAVQYHYIVCAFDLTFGGNCLLLVTGVITLRKYLLDKPLAAQEQNEP